MQWLYPASTKGAAALATPLSPACPLTNEGVPAARRPPRHLEQSAFAHQRFSFSATLANVTLAQAAPVSIMGSINANINDEAENQACPLHLLSVPGEPMAGAELSGHEGVGGVNEAFVLNVLGPPSLQITCQIILSTTDRMHFQQARCD